MTRLDTINQYQSRLTLASHIYIYIYRFFIIKLIFVQMSVGEAREVCKHWWMKEALDRLVDRLIISGELLEEEEQLTDNHLVS